MGQSALPIPADTHLWHTVIGAFICIPAATAGSSTYKRKLPGMAGMDCVYRIRIARICTYGRDLFCYLAAILSGRLV